eukprot:PhM_4_TR13460/c0_g1_i1/m.99071/K08496/GOSR2, BOS1; golgi SNAP receptor complex member 2
MLSGTPKEKRDMWERRVNNLNDEVVNQKRSLERYLQKRAKTVTAQRNREALRLEHSMADQDALGALASEADGIKKAQNEVRSMTRESVALLQALERQRGTMENTHGGLGRIATSLGLSGQVLNTISRVTTVDRLIVYTGMVVMTLLLFCLWYWV